MSFLAFVSILYLFRNNTLIAQFNSHYFHKLYRQINKNRSPHLSALGNILQPSLVYQGGDGSGLLRHYFFGIFAIDLALFNKFFIIIFYWYLKQSELRRKPRSELGSLPTKGREQLAAVCTILPILIERDWTSFVGAQLLETAWWVPPLRPGAGCTRAGEALGQQGGPRWQYLLSELRDLIVPHYFFVIIYQ